MLNENRNIAASRYLLSQTRQLTIGFICLLSSGLLLTSTTACRSGKRPEIENIDPTVSQDSNKSQSLSKKAFKLFTNAQGESVVTSEVYSTFMFKSGLESSTNCQEPADYQEHSFGKPLNDYLKTLPDGEIILCLVGIKADGTPDFENLEYHKWEKKPGGPQAVGSLTAEFDAEPEQKSIALKWEKSDPFYHYLVIRSDRSITWKPQNGINYSEQSIAVPSPDSSAKIDIVYSGNNAEFSDPISDDKTGSLSLHYAVFTFASDLQYSQANHTGIYIADLVNRTRFSWVAVDQDQFMGNAVASSVSGGSIDGYICRIVDFEYEDNGEKITINRAGHLVAKENAPTSSRIKNGTCHIGYQAVAETGVSPIDYKIEEHGSLKAFQPTTFQVYVETPYVKKDNSALEWKESASYDKPGAVNVGTPLTKYPEATTAICRLELANSRPIIGTLINDGGYTPRYCVGHDPDTNAVVHSTLIQGQLQNDFKILHLNNQG